MKQVIILRGIPGCGKSTYIKKNLPDAKVVSADHFFLNETGEYIFNPKNIGLAHQACFKSFIASVQKGIETVVVDNTNISTWEMSPYILGGESHGYSVKIINIKCDPDIAAKRNVHGVPAAAVARMAKSMEMTELLPWWNVEQVQGG